MKKNFKLFSTIASLCLAVALMAFGVWAATTASFKVTSNVSFTASNVYATVKGYSAANSTGTIDTETADAKYNEMTYTEGTPRVSKDLTQDWSVGELSLSETNKFAVIVLTIKNDDATQGIKVKVGTPNVDSIVVPDGLTKGTDYVDSYVCDGTAVVVEGATWYNVAAGATLTITVKREMKNFTKEYRTAVVFWESTIDIQNGTATQA